MKQDSRFPNLFITDHPLIQHKLTHMRDKDTSTRTFRELLREITLLMGYEITRNLPITTKRVETPLVEVDAPVIAGKLAIVPVLRAGIGMSDGLLDLVPSARVGHIGVYRADDHRPVEYLVRLPDLEDRIFILCDPMVATGYSAARGRRAEAPQRASREHHVRRAGRARRRAGVPGRAPGREAVRRVARFAPERACVHRAGPRRRGRPPVRHQELELRTARGAPRLATARLAVWPCAAARIRRSPRDKSRSTRHARPRGFMPAETAADSTTH